MRDVSEPPRRVEPSHSKGAQRRRRLARGVARWDFDRNLCAERTRVIATVTLTVPEADPEAAIGRVYDFWRRVRQTWLGSRYFCWLELQRRGAVHYHCVWLNPPHLKRGQLKAWVAHAWGDGRTQVRFADGRGGLKRELDYVLNYTKKMGRKSYQQRYDEVPRELRTFMSQRLEIPPTEVDKHLERDEWAYHGETTRFDPERPGFDHYCGPYLELVGRLQHLIPIGGRCTALDHRRPRSQPAARPVRGAFA